MPIHVNKPHRKQRFHRDSISPDFVHDLIQNETDKQRLEQIVHALTTLTKKQRTRFLLHHYHGLSITKIAKLENVQYMTVYESIRCAKRYIMNTLKTNDE